jgi:hypothetical protein
MADVERTETGGREPSEARAGDPGVAAGSASREGERPADDEQIRRRAYELYLERKGGTGDERDDWFRAEREHRERSRGRAESGRSE